MSRERKHTAAASAERLQQGFSAIEVLTAVVVFGIIVAVAVPQVREIWDGLERHSIRQQFEFDLIRARQAASAEGARGILALSAGANTYTFGIDFPPYSDPPVADQILFTTQIPERGGITLGKTIIFDARGFHIDKFGVLTQTPFTLQYRGEQYATGTIFPTGAIQ